MEVITTEICKPLKKLIKESHEQVKDKLHQPNQRTHHMNIYHVSWSKNDELCKDIIRILDREYKINPESILSMGWISSHPDGKDQHFHIDYNGVTSTYFIPMVELTDKNGTEFLEFQSSVKNISLFSKLKKIENRFISREGVSGYLSSINVSPDEYTFKIMNGPPYSMVYLPNYVLHRGISNKTGTIRDMFQIVISAVEGANISAYVDYADSELDEDENIIKILMESRNTNE